MLSQRLFFNKKTGETILGNIYSFETQEEQEREFFSIKDDFETYVLQEEEIKEIDNGKVPEIKKGKIVLVEKEVEPILEEKTAEIETKKARADELRQLIRERKASYEELLEYFSITF